MVGHPEKVQQALRLEQFPEEFGFHLHPTMREVQLLGWAVTWALLTFHLDSEFLLVILCLAGVEGRVCALSCIHCQRPGCPLTFYHTFLARLDLCAILEPPHCSGFRRD